jgi:hypothetical protein
MITYNNPWEPPTEFNAFDHSAHAGLNQFCLVNYLAPARIRLNCVQSWTISLRYATPSPSYSRKKFDTFNAVHLLLNYKYSHDSNATHADIASWCSDGALSI